MSHVSVPPVLRGAVGARQIDIAGSTVGEVLHGLTAQYPTVGAQLFSEDGGLRRFVNVYVNEQDIQYLQSLDTSVGPDDTVIILPAMAGG